MNIGNINFCDTANGPGVRVSVFVSGCTNGCKGCFNLEAWNFDFGEVFGYRHMKEIIEKSEPGYISGLSILGGEPLHPKNSEQVRNILERYREHFGQKKNIWIWTGYEYEQLINPIDKWDSSSDDPVKKFYEMGYKDYPYNENSVKIVDLSNVLVTGRFEESLKDLTLKFRGSTNQKLVYV